MFTIGKAKNGRKPMQVQYRQAKEGKQAHWTLPGNTESSVQGPGRNDCLINAICSQSNKDPDMMRSQLAEKIETNQKSIAMQMPDYENLQNSMEKNLFEGGARYQNNIDKIIEDSNKKFSHNSKNLNNEHGVKGHPKGHIPDPSGPTGETDCVKNYSENNHRTSFDSKETTHDFCDTLLKTEKANQAFKKLNSGEDWVELKFNRAEIEKALGTTNLPEVIEYYKRVETKRMDLDSYVFVLRHQHNQKSNPKAPVHIQTAFPKGK